MGYVSDLCKERDVGLNYEWSQFDAIIFELADWEAEVDVVRSGF